ncbi:MAG: chemotaxis protein CheW [Pseudomonadaceae bacterium]|nr:chemotaxis protein CheW [Pseudomonadaceae bacterium]
MTASQLDQLLVERVNSQQEIVDVDEPVIKLVIFRLGEQYFAFTGASIKEVIPGDETIYYLPAMPASVEGVMNVRGDIESVIRLNALLQLTSNEANAGTHSNTANNSNTSTILLGKGKSMQSGLRVDQLLDVVDVPESQLKEAPQALPEYLQPFVTSLLSFNNLAVTVLDLDAVFAAWLAGQG